MKEVGGCGNVANLYVQLGGGLQKALEACAAVFGALSFVAMGQQQGYTVHSVPFTFAGGYKLVYYCLRTVAEIAKLGFPNYQTIRCAQAVAIFEAENGKFAE